MRGGEFLRKVQPVHSNRRSNTVAIRSSMKSPTTQRTRWTLAVTVVVWTLIAWGGRIGLLTGFEDWGAWIRIGGSILIGLIAAFSLVVPWLYPVTHPVLIVLAIWSSLVWARSLFVTWVGSGSFAFKLVHTILAGGFFAISWWAAVTATRGNPVSAPDQRDREEQGEGKPAGLPEG